MSVFSGGYYDDLEKRVKRLEKLEAAAIAWAKARHTAMSHFAMSHESMLERDASDRELDRLQVIAYELAGLKVSR